MFWNLLGSRKKRKPIKVNPQYLNESISSKDKKIILDIISTLDDFILEFEKLSVGKHCPLQDKLKDEKALDMVRAEVLVLCFRYVDFQAGQANWNPEVGSIIYSSILDYIDSLSIKFPTPHFTDSQDFFENRLTHYSQFLSYYLSADKNMVNDSLTWLLSVLSVRLFSQLQSNELSEHKIYEVDFNINNMVLFPAFFKDTFNSLLERIDDIFK